MQAPVSRAFSLVALLGLILAFPVLRAGALHSQPPPAATDTLTFARIETNGEVELLAVLEEHGDEIKAVNLTHSLGNKPTDPIDAYLAHGHDELLTAISAAKPITVARGQLVTPVDLLERNIAAGTNYPEHADEAGVENGPFLFTKMVAPSGPRSDVGAGNALLDYEVELCFVPLTDVSEGARPRAMGLLVCNDYTDRATLLRKIDVFDPASGVGFAPGKSFSGYLPVGEFFVIPRDFRALAAEVELALSVNGFERQRAPFTAAVWDLDRILYETFARRSLAWDYRGDEVTLLHGNATIPARTVIMSGTPHGTVFQGVSLRYRARAVASWLLGGWGRSLPDHAIEAYIKGARSKRLYLQPGDTVVTTATGLGRIVNRITADAPPLTASVRHAN